MPRAAETIRLPGAMPGTRRQWRVFGDPGARPKACLQAGPHAGEPAGMKGCVVSRRRSRQVAFGDFVVALAGHDRPASGKAEALLD